MPGPTQSSFAERDELAGSAATVLQNARTALGAARDDLKSAAQDGRDVIADLK